MSMLGQAENVFHCDVLIDNALLIDFYFNHVYVGLAKKIPSLWEETEKEGKENIQLLSLWKQQLLFIPGIWITINFYFLYIVGRIFG